MTREQPNSRFHSHNISTNLPILHENYILCESHDFQKESLFLDNMLEYICFIWFCCLVEQLYIFQIETSR